MVPGVPTAHVPSHAVVEVKSEHENVTALRQLMEELAV